MSEEQSTTVVETKRKAEEQPAAVVEKKHKADEEEPAAAETKRKAEKDDGTQTLLIEECEDERPDFYLVPNPVLTVAQLVPRPSLSSCAV
jgi:hypothetical protein